MLRYEAFGGIVTTEDPPACVFVDRAFVRELGRAPSPLWDAPDTGVLSAPIEAHYAITDYCPVGCAGCYMGSQNRRELLDQGEAGLARARAICDRLAAMGVFHVALGGGESFCVPWFVALGRHCRRLGMVPNVTTSGVGLTAELAEQCAGVFGQINVSMDGIGDGYGLTRRPDLFDTADSAIRLLREAGVRTGINCVITRPTFDRLEEVVAYAAAHGLVDIEFLRFKPTGRGREVYDTMALTAVQGWDLFPTLKRLSRRHGVRLKLDCSFTPFICCHRPERELLEFFAILGCDAGNWLVGVAPDGAVSPCSFLKHDMDVSELPDRWGDAETFAPLRRWDRETTTVCRRCDYVDLCKGGCHAVTAFLTGSIDGPDPECPLVVSGALAP